MVNVPHTNLNNPITVEIDTSPPFKFAKKKYMSTGSFFRYFKVTPDGIISLRQDFKTATPLYMALIWVNLSFLAWHFLCKWWKSFILTNETYKSSFFLHLLVSYNGMVIYKHRTAQCFDYLNFRGWSANTKLWSATLNISKTIYYTIFTV